MQVHAGERLGEGRFLAAPVQMVCADKIKIGNNVFINSNFLAMSRGGIAIEDDVQIAANVQVLSNNHDPYERQILLCKPVLIKRGAWIGAGATILPGVEIGEYAIVGRLLLSRTMCLIMLCQQEILQK